ncbi:MAG: CHAT domain-containing protein [Anaerolineae bacterium]|nr:CHAT domain-containing protein [Anaerolineae bacterium]
MISGAGSVVAITWAVDDRAKQALTTEFYRKMINE